MMMIIRKSISFMESVKSNIRRIKAEGIVIPLLDRQETQGRILSRPRDKTLYKLCAEVENTPQDSTTLDLENDPDNKD